ncbi:hypothetical protein DFQ01_10614 [Paenibacillus cellulosilyticus]|uniref:Uncharacterized protein n=1 Tax=Paenibacillus cellulosilyticus TaxID=375489 RepID=A0A2V2Z3C9_9BACL|nr:hypothetical protein [Paenibacillus cellulosilyticus]PWW04733.1 hypothetical protein DFQ01_10614 [Paenibacillus cellulosilyticus]QKS45858.1 hypothetical protein HUB94_16475 [Paenibacillus cellulosilyticus]
MTIAIIIWLLFVTAFTLVLRYIRVRQQQLKSTILREIGLSISPVTALLGVGLDDIGYMRHISYIHEKYGEIPIIVLYKGPAWKADLMQRKLSSSVQVIVDEEAELLRKLELTDLPSYLITDQAYRIREHSRIFDAV